MIFRMDFWESLVCSCLGCSCLVRGGLGHLVRRIAVCIVGMCLGLRGGECICLFLMRGLVGLLVLRRLL